MTDRNHRLAVLGLAVLGSIGGGVLMGEQASADMAPFYANLATTMPHERQSEGVEIVSADGSKSWVETPDLSYRSATEGGTMDTAY